MITRHNSTLRYDPTLLDAFTKPRSARSESLLEGSYPQRNTGDQRLLEANVFVADEVNYYTKDRVGFLNHIKRRIGSEIGDAIMERALYGLHQEQDYFRCGTRYTLSVAVLPPEEYKALKKDADEAKALRDKVAKLEAQLKDSTVKAEKFDNIKKALA